MMTFLSSMLYTVDCAPDVGAGHLEGIVLHPSVRGGVVWSGIHLHTVQWYSQQWYSQQCYSQLSVQCREV